MAVSWWKLAWLTPNLGILWIGVCSFWLYNLQTRTQSLMIWNLAMVLNWTMHTSTCTCVDFEMRNKTLITFYELNSVVPSSRSCVISCCSVFKQHTGCCKPTTIPGIYRGNGGTTWARSASVQCKFAYTTISDTNSYLYMSTKVKYFWHQHRGIYTCLFTKFLAVWDIPCPQVHTSSCLSWTTVNLIIVDSFPSETVI